MSKVVTRIAPSPTGYLHFGLARTALFNYLYARENGGEYVLRIEDTDTTRNRSEFEADISEELAWLALTPDRSYQQSEHIERHRECLRKLLADDLAYLSKETARDDPSRTVEVVRLRNRGERVAFNDLVRGEISFDTAELKDFVIARSVDEPLYHFAVVVDDHDEGVTHVIRGEDHISNTPRQILLQRALGFDSPAYAHLPLILMPDKSKMSKRKHETSLKHYREAGMLPEAILNYLAHLGWTPPSGKEILSLEEMTAEFELKDLHKNGAVFDIEKLRWFNREYLLKLPEEDFAEKALLRLREALSARGLPWNENVARKLSGLIRECVSVWEDIAKFTEAGEFDFFFGDPSPDPASIPQKGISQAQTATHLRSLEDILRKISDTDFSDSEKVKMAVWPYAEREGRGAVLWPLRYALSGRAKSPDPFMIASVVGKEAALRRIRAALEMLGTEA